VGAPDFAIERRWLARGIGPVAGIDEAGRGPWAGPVVAAAVILDPKGMPEGIDDSKALAETQREALFEEIMAGAWVGVGIADVARIDRDNILQATLWAMREAASRLAVLPGVCLIDGNAVPRLPCAVEAVVKGDARSLSIAAASIVAKVTRDRLMGELAGRHPGYGWERNKGYGTPAHRAGIARLGVTPEHRRSFRPVALALEGQSGLEDQNEESKEGEVT
jgi:ribonuclease HII